MAQITGTSLNNLLTGASDNDTIDGGLGADTMVGGLGDDTYIVDNVSDVITESANAGTDTVQSSINYVLGDNVEKLILTGSSAINGSGNALANRITGNTANNILDGGAGIDTLIGGLGNDSYIVDAAGETITENANEGTDTVQSAVSYTLGANLENLTLTGTGTRNGVGNSLNNILIGNAGNNVLNGSTGIDTMVGGLGNDTYIVDAAGETVTENANAGIDTVQSSVSYTLGANLENLTLTGTGTRNGVGNSLNNILTGNSGNNILTGGKGNDTYSFGRTSLHDTLIDTDNTVGNSDTLLCGADVRHDQLWFKQVGNDLQVDIIGTTNSATIKNYYLGQDNHIEVFRSGNHEVLLDSQVQNLVSVMAGMTEPAFGQLKLSVPDHDILLPVFNANWKEG